MTFFALDIFKLVWGHTIHGGIWLGHDCGPRYGDFVFPVVNESAPQVLPSVSIASSNADQFLPLNFLSSSSLIARICWVVVMVGDFVCTVYAVY